MEQKNRGFILWRRLGSWLRTTMHGFTWSQINATKISTCTKRVVPRTRVFQCPGAQPYCAVLFGIVRISLKLCINMEVKMLTVDWLSGMAAVLSQIASEPGDCRTAVELRSAVIPGIMPALSAIGDLFQSAKQTSPGVKAPVIGKMLVAE